MFKEVKGFEKYSVTNDGDVCGPRGLLRPWIGRGGYLKVCLSNGSKRRWTYVHRLVCECYHEQIAGKIEVNHKDGNKFNNNIDNLEWVTRAENNIHAFREGLKAGVRGEKNVGHKLTENQVLEIRKLRGIKTQREIEVIYGVSHSHVSKIQRNENWKEVAHV